MSLTHFNREACVVHEGTEYRFSEEDFKQLGRPSSYWRDPSAVASIFGLLVFSNPTRRRDQFESAV